MNTALRLAASLALWATCFGADAADALQIPSTPPYIVQIPSGVTREVLGVWEFKLVNCSRSLELVAGELLLVPRCEPHVAGTTGIPLRKDPTNAMRYVHRFVPTTTYEISGDGYLVMSANGQVFMVGVPASPPSGAPAR
jgi:hypothetical protein